MTEGEARRLKRLERSVRRLQRQVRHNRKIAIHAMATALYPDFAESLRAAGEAAKNPRGGASVH